MGWRIAYVWMQDEEVAVVRRVSRRTLASRAEAEGEAWSRNARLSGKRRCVVLEPGFRPHEGDLCSRLDLYGPC